MSIDVRCTCLTPQIFNKLNMLLMEEEWRGGLIVNVTFPEPEVKKHNYPKQRRSPRTEQPTNGSPRVVAQVQGVSEPINLSPVEGKILEVIMRECADYKPFDLEKIRAQVLIKGVLPNSIGGAMTSLMKKKLLVRVHSGNSYGYRLHESVVSVTEVKG